MQLCRSTCDPLWQKQTDRESAECLRVDPHKADSSLPIRLTSSKSLMANFRFADNPLTEYGHSGGLLNCLGARFRPMHVRTSRPSRTLVSLLIGADLCLRHKRCAAQYRMPMSRVSRAPRRSAMRARYSALTQDLKCNVLRFTRYQHYCGKPTFRVSSWNRGSVRSGSNSGVTFRPVSSCECCAYAFSSHTSACSLSPTAK